MRLLLVEDDPRLAALILEGLAEDGLTLEHAQDATTAESVCALRSFDLLLLDVMLPEGPQAGFELADLLRSRQDRTPILFLTARSDLDSRVTGLDTGGDDYLTKPFEFRELRARVRATCGVRWVKRPTPCRCRWGSGSIWPRIRCFRPDGPCR